MPNPLVNQDQIDAYQNLGVCLIKGLFADHVDELRAGIERNMSEPGEYAAEVAADLMQSETVQMFHDHVLVKEAGTSKPTPWHQDAPYYFVDGMQNISFWAPVDPVTEATLRCVAGSHKWPKQVLPTKWLNEDKFYPNEEDYMPVPDPDEEGMDIREWEMEPGDAVAFHYGVLHGAKGNYTSSRRRAFSLRLLGDDARYVERPGKTSPPFPGHNMVAGDRLREDWFPVIWKS